ncbi:hypothetical protein [Falsirhodobacter algicola]|uniref:DUF2125 domain-containing protein n=1 Tax=Falsirhodobacter algicola TaxID=2692330 RepID=A0A8J8SLI9_9RHOB|nr:hypothetical protein [Falsirhodobacter algicola]QUS36464.1 hypothetical protein GR316_09445 [Falsirhodobacter algicola]
MKPSHLASAGVAALLLATTTAGAAVTPEQVWSDWQATAERRDQTLTGTAQREGDSLVVTGLRITQTEGASRLDGTIDRMTFAGQGDGTVRITMSERVPLTLVSEDGASGPVTSHVDLTQDGMVTIASGDPGAIRYDMTARSVTAVLDDATRADGTALPVAVTLALRDLKGLYGSGDAVDGTGTAGRVDLSMKGADGTLDWGMQDVTLTALGQAGPTGFLGQSGLAYAASTFRAESGAQGRVTRAEGGTGPGVVNLSVAADTVDYDTDVEDADLHVEHPDLPGPLDLKVAHLTSDTSVPMQGGESTLALALTDVTASDASWALLDPQGKLPRAPAQLRLRMRTEGAPGEVQTVTLEDFDLQAVGAQLSATGQSTLDPAAPVTPGPLAELGRGRISLTLRGGTALVDRLSAARILSPQAEMFARMSLGTLGRAVPGQTDTLTSVIQFGNGLSINGVPMQ